MTQMTQLEMVRPAERRPPIFSRGLLLVWIGTFGAATSFYLLLSVVPLYAGSTGAGGGAAGLVTGALMVATVAGELATPRLVGRYGYRVVLTGGLLLLGAPALALTVTADFTVIVAVCLIRGLGFGVVVVAGGALAASLIPPERRGEGLGLSGVIAGAPGVAALPAGIWLAGNVGYPAVFVAGSTASLVVIMAAVGLTGRRSAMTPRSAAGRIGMVAGLRMPILMRPALLFTVIAMSAGIMVTFLPLAVTQASGGLAALALFAQTATTTLARWLAGRYGDRHGPARLLIPGVLIAACGMLILSLITVPIAVVAGALIFGAGFGIAQNATIALMFARVPAEGYGTVSALWNIGFDAGMGLGAAGFGLIVTGFGYPGAFALTAAFTLIALAPAWRDREG